MNPFQQLQIVLGLTALAMIVASVVFWGRLFSCWFAGKEGIPYAERRPVPWGPDGFLVVFVLLMVVATIVKQLALHMGWLVLPAGEYKDVDLEPRTRATLLVIGGLAYAIATFMSAGWLTALHRARTKDFGLPVSLRHIMLGVVGTAVLLPPVFVLQYMLVRWVMPYEHDVVKVLVESADLSFFVPMVIVSVLIAPVAEEFTFRVVLQGWLETLGTRLNVSTQTGAINNAAPEASGDAVQQESESDSPYVPATTVCDCPDESAQPAVPYWPILVSSLVFACFHLGQGPAPITLFFLSIGLGYLYRQTHSIWPSLVVHMILNALTMLSLGLSIAAGEPLQ